jgi:hypothetical protein
MKMKIDLSKKEFDYLFGLLAEQSGTWQSYKIYEKLLKMKTEVEAISQNQRQGGLDGLRPNKATKPIYRGIKKVRAKKVP